jgi:hypothetical protein
VDLLAGAIGAEAMNRITSFGITPGVVHAFPMSVDAELLNVCYSESRGAGIAVLTDDNCEKDVRYIVSVRTDQAFDYRVINYIGWFERDFLAFHVLEIVRPSDEACAAPDLSLWDRIVAALRAFVGNW